MTRRLLTRVWLMIGLLAAPGAQARSTTCTPHLVGSDRRGLSGEVELAGDRAVVASGAALLVFDFTSGQKPREIGSVALEDIVRQVAVDGDVAAVLGLRSIGFVDLSDPEHPTLGTTVPIAGTTRYSGGLDAVGGHTFLATCSNGLTVYDSHDPFAVIEVGGYGGFCARAVTVGGERAYVTTSDGLAIFDVSDPTEPRRTADLSEMYGRVGLSPDLKQLSTLSNPCGPRHCCTDFRLYDLSDPDLPVPRGEWYGYDACGTGRPILLGERAYVATDPGFAILDIGDPTQPSELAAVDIGSSAIGAAASDGVYYLTDSRSVLHRFEVEDPATIVESARFRLPRGSRAVLLDGTLAVVEELDGLRTLDLADPSGPKTLGEKRFAEDQFTDRLAGIGAYVYAVGSNLGTLPFDLSDPARPRALTPISSVPTARPRRWGNRLYLRDLSVDGGIEIRNLEDPESPTLISTFGEGERLRLFSADASHLFATKIDYDGYLIYDVADPDHVRLVGERPGGGGFSASLPRGSLHAFTTYEGLRIDDVSDPTAPLPISFLPFEGAGYGIAAYGSRVFVPRGAYGLETHQVLVVDVSDPTLPRVVAELETPGTPEDVAAGPGLLVVADGPAGVSIFDTCQPFADGFESGDASAWSSIAP